MEKNQGSAYPNLDLHQPSGPHQHYNAQHQPVSHYPSSAPVVMSPPAYGPTYPATINSMADRPSANYSASSGNIVVVQNQPVLGPEPRRMACPHCHAEITTRMKTEANSKTYLFSALLCMSVACCPCFWIPCCMDGCQSRRHYCPNCQSYLGEYDH